MLIWHISHWMTARQVLIVSIRKWSQWPRRYSWKAVNHGWTLQERYGTYEKAAWSKKWGEQDVWWRRLKGTSIGYWTHCRRLWVDVLPSDSIAMDIINHICNVFRNEEVFRVMKLIGEQIKEKRLKLTGFILKRIYHYKVIIMMQDAKIMQTNWWERL